MSQPPPVPLSPVKRRAQRKGRNPDNIIRCGYDPPTTPEDIQTQFQVTPSSRGSKEWCILFNLTQREWNLWRQKIRGHLRQPSGHVGSGDATSHKGGLYAVGGKEWAWWQLTPNSTNTNFFIMAGSLLYDIMADEQFKGYFAQSTASTPTASANGAPQCGTLRSTTWTWSYVDDETYRGKKVKRIVPGFPLKLEILKQWIFSESRDMQNIPELRDRFTETEVIPHNTINPAYLDDNEALQASPRKKNKRQQDIRFTNSILYIAPDDDDPNTWVGIHVTEILNDPNKFYPSDVELEDVRFRKLRDKVDSALGTGALFYIDDEEHEQRVDSTMALKEALSVLQAHRKEDATEKLKLRYE